MTAYELARLAVSTRTEQTQTMALQALQELGLQDYVVAIDFDGTLCQSEYPEIGEPNLLIIEHAKMLQRYHIGTILWTCREGQLLDDAVAWCTERGLNFDAINKNTPSRIKKWGTDPRKVGANEYWDDLAVRIGGANP